MQVIKIHFEKEVKNPLQLKDTISKIVKDYKGEKPKSDDSPIDIPISEDDRTTITSEIGSIKGNEDYSVKELNVTIKAKLNWEQNVLKCDSSNIISLMVSKTYLCLNILENTIVCINENREIIHLPRPLNPIKIIFDSVETFPTTHQ